MDHNQLRRDLMEVLQASKHNTTVKIKSANTLYTLFMVRERLQQMMIPDEVSRQVILKQIVWGCVTTLEASHPHYVKILRLRYEQGLSMQEAADKMVKGLEPARKLRTQAVDALFEEMMRREANAQAAHNERMQNQLGIRTFDTLFGVQALLNAVGDLLLAPKAPHIIVLTGMGGIGKTVLAQTVARDSIAQNCFEAVVWTTVDSDKLAAAHQVGNLLGYLAQLIFPHLFPNQSAPAQPYKRIECVRQQLKSAPYLIIIDNIETKIDREVCNQLHTWTQPSRFLLTSRCHLESDVGLHTVRVPELSLPHALALLRHQTEVQGVCLPTDFEETFAPIYAIVAGNPYALKLVASLLQHFDVQTIAADFERARSADAQALYAYIFERVWDVLAADAQRLLKALWAFSASGATRDELEVVSGLEIARLNQAILALRHTSLLEMTHNELQQATYFIHALTRAFVQVKVNWPQALSRNGVALSNAVPASND